MSLNKDRRRLAYTNVKNFMTSRRKELRFNLHPHLEREEDLAKELRMLERLDYKSYAQLPVSWVIAENLGEENEAVAMNFKSDGDFWNFLYSDNWKSCSSLRITTGELLNKFLDIFYVWITSDEVKTYKIARFDRLYQTVRGGMKKRSVDQGTKTKPVKITFTYYAVNDSNTKNVDKAVRHAGGIYQSLNQGNNTPATPAGITVTGSPGITHTRVSISDGQRDTGLPVLVSFSESGVAGLPVFALNPEPSGSEHPSPGISAIPMLDALLIPGKTLVRTKSELSCRDRSRGRLASIPSRVGPNAKKLPYRMLSTLSGYELTEEISWNNVKKLKLPPVKVTNDAPDFHTDLDERQCISTQPESDLCESNPGSTLATNARRPRHPVMTDPSEHVILSDDEDDERECRLDSSAELTRAAHPSLESYLKTRHNRVKLSRKKQHHAGTLHAEEPIESEEEDTDKKDAIETEERPTLSKFLFQRNKRSPRDRAPSAGGTDNHPEQCTCADGVPPCKTGGDADGAGRQREDTVRSWCIPLTRQQKYRLDLEGRRRPTIPPLQTNRLDARHSITRMRRIERHWAIRESLPPRTPERQALMEKLDWFLQTNYLPKLRHEVKPERPPVKLNPRRRSKKPAAESGRCVPVSAVYEPLSTSFRRKVLFPQPESRETFAENLRKALRLFVVRKEQVTKEEGWHTTTSITITRRLHLTYGEPDVRVQQATVRAAGETNVLTLCQ